jgi:hypothetical protein
MPEDAISQMQAAAERRKRLNMMIKLQQVNNVAIPDDDEDEDNE